MIVFLFFCINYLVSNVMWNLRLPKIFCAKSLTHPRNFVQNLSPHTKITRPPVGVFEPSLIANVKSYKSFFMEFINIGLFLNGAIYKIDDTGVATSIFMQKSYDPLVVYINNALLLTLKDAIRVIYFPYILYIL